MYAVHDFMLALVNGLVVNQSTKFLGNTEKNEAVIQ